MTDISERLAQRLKGARKAKGLSLEALSRLSGVSRSMLSQIERGESSPTVASLWNLTQALQVDFSGLLDDKADSDDPFLEHLPADRTPVIQSRGEKCIIRILSPMEEAGRSETYHIAFQSGGALVSEAHGRGCIEHLSILEGACKVTSGGFERSAVAGDTIRYRADLPHSISAEGAGASVILIVHNSENP
ncbi:MAG: helix-turn-helix domain-containing protein [Pikeienuella sp.]